MALFLSTFVKIALREPFNEWDDWPGILLLWNMTGKEFPQSCGEGQRAAVPRFLHHLMLTRREQLEEHHLQEDLEKAIERWRAPL